MTDQPRQEISIPPEQQNRFGVSQAHVLRMLVDVAILLSALAIVLLLWFQMHVLLLGFAGVLLAVFLYTISEWVRRTTNMPYWLSLCSALAGSSKHELHRYRAYAVAIVHVLLGWCARHAGAGIGTGRHAADSDPLSFMTSRDPPEPRPGRLPARISRIDSNQRAQPPGVSSKGARHRPVLEAGLYDRGDSYEVDQAMIQLRSSVSWNLLTMVVVAVALVASTPRGAGAAVTVAKPGANAPVSITDNGNTWTMENGIVKVIINKRNGDPESLIYNGIDTLGHDQGRVGGWEQDPSGAPDLKQTITIDPAKNGGQRGEVSIAGKTGGTVMLTPNAPGGGTMCDIEIRYAMGGGDSGVYVYAIFSHPKEYGAMGVGESRFITRLNQAFDWISVDADRNMLECAPTDWGTGVVVHAKEQRILTKGVYKNSVEHKYSYNAVQYKIPAYGWSSTKEHIGVWFINPTIEYLSGGASKQELVCHFGDNGNPDPIILNYWRGTHYGGGAQCNINAGEEWSKVIGPIFIYVNSLSDFDKPSDADLATLKATEGNPTVPPAWKDNATALWQDALSQAKQQKSQWPYDWVNGVDYPHKDQRGTVTGQLVLDDPQASTTKLPHLTVGLAHPDYPAGTGGRGGFGRGGAPGRGPAAARGATSAPAIARGGFGGGFGGGNRMIDWAHDAKFYQFWNDGSEDGKFTITDVRPGTYTLHAFADGVLGEFAKADITVEPGKTLDLGTLDWKPVRDGKQIWEIGYPDRTGDKFYKGDGENYWLWGWGLRYPLLFPNDITYTIGKSDYHKDWFFQQVPHGESTAWLNPDAKDPANQRFGWVKAETLEQYPQTNTSGPWRIYGHGRATTWTIKFNMDTQPRGQAALRIALAGADGNGGLIVGVNGKDAGTIHPVGTNALRYNTNKSVWQEQTLTFDASMMKQGENEMTLTVPAGDITTGVVYDYLRLELNENATP